MQYNTFFNFYEIYPFQVNFLLLRQQVLDTFYIKYFSVRHFSSNQNGIIQSEITQRSHKIGQEVELSLPLYQFNRWIRIFWMRIHLKMHQNSKCQCVKLINNVLMIGFRNYREDYIKTVRAQNKETKFHKLTDPKVCFKGLIKDKNISINN